jgi:hypothetical protein
MNEKSMKAEQDRLERQMPVSTSPGHIGYGYQNQRAYIDEVDRNNDRLYQAYQQ